MYGIVRSLVHSFCGMHFFVIDMCVCVRARVCVFRFRKTYIIELSVVTLH